MAIELRTVLTGMGDQDIIVCPITGGTKQTIITESILGEASDVAVNVTADVSAMKALLIYASGELTLETNSSSAPQDTFELAANTAVLWVAGAPGTNACPFAGDVTKIYATNEGASSVSLTIKIVEDATV